MTKLKTKFKKIIPVTMLLAAMLTFAPLSSFAVELDVPLTEEEEEAERLQFALDFSILSL
ncbi:hypothetical protein BM86_34400 [Bacillus thuringiensis]|nr:hypothetical protein [Bacillus thuringiensis]MBH0340393.1 hypothetical protein [Bacillus thuringiensis]